MSANYHQLNPNRLHSPLLDPLKKEKNKEISNIRGKKVYYNPNEENQPADPIDETLDNTLFTDNKNTNNTEKIKPYENNLINNKSIDLLELLFKIACIFILATGGMLSLLEFINVVRTLYSGSLDFGNSLIVFVLAFIGTILANLICIGFIHLIRTTRYLYLNCENQKNLFEKLLSN